jgi:hypothetical protein
MNFLAPLVRTKYTFTNDVTNTNGGRTNSDLQTKKGEGVSERRTVGKATDGRREP